MDKPSIWLADPGDFLFNFQSKVWIRQCSIHFYTNCDSSNDLVMLRSCPKLTNHLHPDILLGITFILISNGMDFCHGQMLIETETDSYRYPLEQNATFIFSKGLIISRQIYHRGFFSWFHWLTCPKGVH